MFQRWIMICHLDDGLLSCFMFLFHGSCTCSSPSSSRNPWDQLATPELKKITGYPISFQDEFATNGYDKKTQRSHVTVLFHGFFQPSCGLIFHLGSSWNFAKTFALRGLIWPYAGTQQIVPGERPTDPNFGLDGFHRVPPDLSELPLLLCSAMGQGLGTELAVGAGMQKRSKDSQLERADERVFHGFLGFQPQGCNMCPDSIH